MLGKIPIALIPTRNSHHSPCPITGQNIIPDPNWNRLLGERMRHIGPCKYAGNSFDIRHTVAFRALGSSGHVFLDGPSLVGGSQ